MTITKRLTFSFAALAVLAGIATATLSPSTAFAAGRDCDDNSILRCGALTQSELAADYKANESGDLAHVYSHYGITASMINAQNAKNGTLTEDGKVIVDGKTVATGAETVGRHYFNGSRSVVINGKTYYQRSTSISISRTMEVFVYTDANGKFVSAIIKDCGNPVKATPTTPAPQPAAACTSLTFARITRNEFTFTATASASNGGTISGYRFTITSADGTVQNVNVASTAKLAKTGTVALEDGVSTAKVVVTTSLGAKESAACVVKVTVNPLPPQKTEVCNPETGEPMTVDEKDASKYKPVGDAACQPVQVCNPETGQPMTVKQSEKDKYRPVNDEACKVQGVTTVKEIPSTGPTDMIGGGIGLTSLAAAGYYWRASRRQLLSSLLNR